MDNPSVAQLIPQSKQQMEVFIERELKHNGDTPANLSASGDWYEYPTFPGGLAPIVGQVYRIEGANNFTQIYKITNLYVSGYRILVQVSWDWYLRNTEQ